MTDQPYDNFAIILHTDGQRVLLFPGADGWAPPSHTQTEAPAITRAMRERLGVETVVLRCLYDRARFAPDARQQIYALESLSPNWDLPAGARWMDRATLARITLAHEWQRATIDGWLGELERSTMPFQPRAWELPGWFASASEWIAEQAERAGRPLTGAVEQAQARAWACVLRAPTARGAIYMKAAIPLYGFEPALTQALAALAPAHIPPVVATDTARGWLLTADAGPSVRDLFKASDPAASWPDLLAQFARMQIAAAPHIADYLATGCSDRRLERLPHLYDDLIARRDVLLVEQAMGLSEADWKRARAMSSEVAALCAELASYDIPQSIHHDDFGAGNILRGRDGAYVFIDWSDGAITHPFCSMVIPLRWARYLLSYEEPALARMRAAYLEQWSAFGAPERLDAAFALAHRLGKLVRALTWADFSAAMPVEVAWEYADSAPYWLRMFLNDDEGD